MAIAAIRASAAAFIACAFVFAPAGAADKNPLDSFLDGLKSLRTSFTQTLVDGKDRVADRSTGTLVVLRPGKFRWEVKSEKGNGNQLLVADGKNVWFFDEELEQVTVKPASAALSSTPAMLLSGAAEVRENFKVSSAGNRDALDWVLVEPRASDADFRRALLGFGKNGLARMIVDDKLGQTATMTFEDMRRNVDVAASEMSFKPPAGVDVIGTPTR